MNSLRQLAEQIAAEIKALITTNQLHCLMSGEGGVENDAVSLEQVNKELVRSHDCSTEIPLLVWGWRTNSERLIADEIMKKMGTIAYEIELRGEERQRIARSVLDQQGARAALERAAKNGEGVVISPTAQPFEDRPCGLSGTADLREIDQRGDRPFPPMTPPSGI